MTDRIQNEKHAQLIRLIRKIAREEAWQTIDEHLNDYIHREKPAENTEVQ